MQRQLHTLGSSASAFPLVVRKHSGLGPQPRSVLDQERCSLCSKASSSALVSRQRQADLWRWSRRQNSTQKLRAISEPQWTPALGELAEGLETPVQAIYLATLLGFLVVGAYLVVRQVLIRRELEEAAKVLGDRIRTGSASSEDFFELGVILLRKKLFTQAVKNLEKAKKAWDGEADELAQVHNALGFAYFNMDKPGLAIENYRKAVDLQPGYVTAWNNLGDAYEKARDWKGAYTAYSEALSYAPDNKIARERSETLRSRAQATR